MLILHTGQVRARRPAGRARLDPIPGTEHHRATLAGPIVCTPHLSDPRGPRPIPMGPGTRGSHPDIFPPAPPPHAHVLPTRLPRPLHLQTVPSSFLLPSPARPRPVSSVSRTLPAASSLAPKVRVLPLPVPVPEQQERVLCVASFTPPALCNCLWLP